MCDFFYYICFGKDRRYPKILFLESDISRRTAYRYKAYYDELKKK